MGSGRSFIYWEKVLQATGTIYIPHGQGDPLVGKVHLQNLDFDNIPDLHHLGGVLDKPVGEAGNA